MVTIPHFRTDIENGIEADWDVAEEIARIYGYYNIQPTLMRGDTFRGQHQRACSSWKIEVKDTLLVSLGLYEMYNYNFTSPSVFDSACCCPRTANCVMPFAFSTPLARIRASCAPRLIPGMLDSLAFATENRKSRTSAVSSRLVIRAFGSPARDLPEERKKIGVDPRR